MPSEVVMPDDQETRSERTTLAFTPTEMKALEYVAHVHGTKYSGIGEVMRDYSVSDAVEFHRRAVTLVSGVA